MSARCDEVRETLWPLERPRRLDRREQEARAHLAGCEDCRRFFARDAQLTGVLRAGIGAATAPRELRERVFDALARERTRAAPGAPARPVAPTAGRRWRIPPRAAVAVTASLVVGALLWLRTDDPDSERLLPQADAYVDDYMRVAALELALPAEVDSSVIGRFYMQELGRRIVPIPLEDARVVRVLICQVHGRRGAMIEYEVNGTRLAHYRLPVGRRGEPPTPVVVGSEMGVRVARWRDGEYENALVSEMPAEDLRRLTLRNFTLR